MHTCLLPIKGHLRKVLENRYPLYVTFPWLKKPVEVLWISSATRLARIQVSLNCLCNFLRAASNFPRWKSSTKTEHQLIHQWAKPRKPPKIKDLSNHTCLKISIPRNFQVKPLALGRFAQNLWNDSNFPNTSMYVCLLLRCCYLESWL